MPAGKSSPSPLLAKDSNRLILRTARSTGTNDYAVANDWEVNLKALLTRHAVNSPIGAAANFKVIAGDARKTFRAYLKPIPNSFFRMFTSIWMFMRRPKI